MVEKRKQLCGKLHTNILTNVGKSERPEKRENK